jgi:nucleoside-diphosphate-sugar epimerase
VASHGRQSVVEAPLLDETILIYGATGYTGRLIAKAASDRGAHPILAGRNLDKVKRVAEPLGLSARAFDLGDPARIDAAIKDVAVVLCAAGPFSMTSRWRMPVSAIVFTTSTSPGKLTSLRLSPRGTPKPRREA